MKPVVILGVFVADTAYRAQRQPRMGETILGTSFKLGPGGKGSNQAVAAGRLGADVTFLTRLGVDAFAAMAKQTWKDAGVKSAVIDTPDSYTGAAYIFVEEASGNNAIIVSPGAAMLISPADIESHANLIRSAGVFVTQLEQPIDSALKALEIAREAGLGITIHAGELMGWESVAAALDHIRPARIGHGVRAIENPDLVRRIAAEGVVLECCPGSNLALGVFPDFAGHPFPALKAAGCKVTLNSDDPPYFRTSLKREYDIAADHFAMNEKALAAITRTAIEAAFVDRKTRAALLTRLDGPKR